MLTLFGDRSRAASAEIVRASIRDEIDFTRHVDYVHINPVKHGLVVRVRDRATSSFHRHVELGNYPAAWAGDLSDDDGDYGEQ